MYIQIHFALGLVDYKSDIALVNGLCGYVLKGLEYYPYKPSPQQVLLMHVFHISQEASYNKKIFIYSSFFGKKIVELGIYKH